MRLMPVVPFESLLKSTVDLVGQWMSIVINIDKPYQMHISSGHLF